MIGCGSFFGFGGWWLFPLIMVVLCFFMMRRCMGRMMRGNRFSRISSETLSDSKSLTPVDSARGIVKKQ
jgi:hypothetical protein